MLSEANTLSIPDVGITKRVAVTPLPMLQLLQYSTCCNIGIDYPQCTPEFSTLTAIIDNDK